MCSWENGSFISSFLRNVLANLQNCYTSANHHWQGLNISLFYHLIQQLLPLVSIVILLFLSSFLLVFLVFGFCCWLFFTGFLYEALPATEHTLYTRMSFNSNIHSTVPEWIKSMCQHLMITILSSVRWNSKVSLICILLVSKDAENF